MYILAERFVSWDDDWSFLIKRVMTYLMASKSPLNSTILMSPTHPWFMFSGEQGDT
jgi:hypothetical protein